MKLYERSGVKLTRQIPSQYVQAMQVIWMTCGKATFAFNQVSDKIPSGPGVIKKLHNDGYISDCGRLHITGSGNQRTWKLSTEMVSACEAAYGPVKDEREERTAVSLANIRSPIETQKAREIKARRQAERYRARTTLKNIDEDLRILESILYRVMEAPVKNPRAKFTYAELKTHGIVSSHQTLPRLSLSGWVIREGRVSSGRDTRYWSLSDRTINRIVGA